MNIPLLTAQDVEARVQQVTDRGGAIILLYKNARVDMAILDEVFGPMNWQRSHQVIDGRLYCTVSVWDSEKQQWISKQDVGTESQTEKEKGQASDSFKRACFNLGIGRELYNSPFIFIQLKPDEVATGKSGKKTTYIKFNVTELEYNPQTRTFTRLTIVDGKGAERYRVGSKNVTQAKTEPKKPTQASTKTEPAARELVDKYVVRVEGGRCLVEVQKKWYDVNTLDRGQLEYLMTRSEYKDAQTFINKALDKLLA